MVDDMDETTINFVILMKFNLPPWLCMKQQFFLLFLLILGPSVPGINIDVCLQPLVAELKDLWDICLSTSNASSKENFQMRAALLWTISDSLGYAILFGWSSKGELACLVCNNILVHIGLRMEASIVRAHEVFKP